ncbi:F5/8 type C domain protein [Erythrobacter phage vB_EliS-L02]|nr:F5/8 type C domain protein [Erythrobacter phage vB_EliS-L02]
MKTITQALSDHLDQEVTTLCSCWRIVRRDGQEFYFTDHDQDVVFEGNTYEAESSYDRTAVQSTSDFGVSNLDVSGILDSEKIRDEELRAGLFNRADVYVFIVNWQAPDSGALKVRRGWFGEVTLLDNGTFMTEIRGLAQALTHNWIEVYSAECRADFCDSRCKLNIADYTHRGSVTSTSDGRSQFVASDIPDAPTTSTSVGAHRYWSFKPTGIPNGVWFELAQLRFRDQSGNLIQGGTAFDNIPRGLDSDSPNRLRDGKYHTTWGFNSAWNDENDDDDPDIPIGDVRWWIDFGQAVDIAQIEVIAGEAGLAPSAFDIQYLDTEPTVGSIWNAGASFAFTFAQDGQSALFAFGSAGQGPINIAETPQNLPAPFTGASTYVGGTITWITGKNAGRVVEIIGYDDATNTIDLFEGMSYQIEVGDLFDIAQGCDGSLAACKLYNNVVNRRAEDYIPGNDEFMSYPDATS